jgi:hypothetical protein
MTAWSDCPPCPGCKRPCGTGRPSLPSGSLRCVACGHEWRETDPERIAQAERADEAWRVECARIDEEIAARAAPYRRTR